MIPEEDILQQVQYSLVEDIGHGDITAQFVPAADIATAQIISREDAIICGKAWVNNSFLLLDKNIQITWHVDDAMPVVAGQVLCQITGNARTLLTAERTALNFLQTLSATATQTQHYVQAVQGSSVKIVDTRKTIPGLRRAQKYAVLCGGGANHRHGLYDGVLIKENHIMAAGSISKAVRRAKAHIPHGLKVEVEVETLAELEEALTAGVELLLLDNMNIATLTQAVQINQGKALLEASGNITLETIKHVAQTGVDFISVGALTKHIKAIDLSMRFVVKPN